MSTKTCDYVDDALKTSFVHNQPNSEIEGLVRIESQLISMRLSELKSLVLADKPLVDILLLNWTAETYKSFCEIANGVMQADGHIGGSFINPATLSFRPVWFISQNASDESIRFFTILQTILNSLGAKVSFAYYLTSSGN